MEKYQYKKLDEVCKFLNGGTPSKENADYFNGNIPWITGADITSFLVRKVRSFITEKAVKDSATNLVSEGTVLLVTRTSVGKVAVAGMPLCFSQDITAIRNDEKQLDKSFLIYFLKTKEPYFKQSARGATIGGITREVVSQVEIPLPSLDEQKRIAAILDKADRLRRQRRFAQTLSDSFLQSVFIKMFGDPVSNSMNWEIKRFTSFCKKITDGTHFSPPEVAVGVPYITAKNIKIDGIDLRKLTYVSEKHHQEIYKRCDPKIGDILYIKDGATTGIAKVNNLRYEFSMLSSLALLRTDPLKMSPYFLENFLNFPSVFDSITAQMKGGAIKRLTIDKIKELESIVPPLPLQEKFAEIVQKFERVRRQQREATRQAEHLFQTLLHRAFRGEL